MAARAASWEDGARALEGASPAGPVKMDAANASKQSVVRFRVIIGKRPIVGSECRFGQARCEEDRDARRPGFKSIPAMGNMPMQC
jgi:hypothetical protein